MKTALIGCGRIGFILENDPLRHKPCTHYGGATAAGMQINYACDINPERLKMFSDIEKIPANNLFSDYKQLLRKHKPDLVIIATWTESHAPICEEAARNGASLIVLEKPIAHNLKAAQRMIDICSDTKTALIINHERRYLNKYKLLKKLITQNIIGDIKTVHASMLTAGYRGKSNINEGGGPLLHDGTHLVDILRFLLGDIKSIRGEFQRNNRDSGYEDRATAWMKTNDGIDIFLEAGGNREYFMFDLDIYGTKGRIVIGNGYEKLFIKSKSKFYSGFNDLIEKAYPRYKENNCFQDLYREIKKILHDKTTFIQSSGIDGYRSLEVIHGIYLSSFKKGIEVKLPIQPKKVNISKIFELE